MHIKNFQPFNTTPKETIVAYKYNGVSRPDLGVINGEVYFADEVREAGFFRSKEIRIGDRWFTWAGFTEVLVDSSLLKSINRNKTINSILS